MRTTAFFILAALTAAPTLAHAQPGAAPIQAAPAPRPAEPDYRELSPGTALALSLGITAAGYGAAFVADSSHGDSDALGLLAAGGIILGPSFGHWYQEDIWTRGLSLRLGGGTVAMLAAVSMIDFCFDDSCQEEDHTGAMTLFYVGALAFAAGTIDDIVSAPINASKRNRENRARFVQNLALVPQVSGDRGGLVLSGRF